MQPAGINQGSHNVYYVKLCVRDGFPALETFVEPYPPLFILRQSRFKWKALCYSPQTLDPLGLERSQHAIATGCF